MFSPFLHILNDFLEALKTLHSVPHNDKISKFEYFAKTHIQYADVAHAVPSFLAWHRVFLREMEKQLQQINPKVVLPYWDWSLDSQAPHDSPILKEKFFGGERGENCCLVSGPFANWTMQVPYQHCLRRCYDSDNEVSALPPTEEIILDLNEPEFSEFSNQIEAKHGYPHANIGGEDGDFFTMYSPNDPLFYLHHTFVDLLWAEWQKRHPESEYEGKSYNMRVSVEDILIPFDVPVKSTLDTTDDSYCYTYPEYPRLIIPPQVPAPIKEEAEAEEKHNPFLRSVLAKSRLGNLLGTFSGRIKSRPFRLSRLAGIKNSVSSIFSKHSRVQSKKVKPTKSLPESFIRMNNLNVNSVRQREARSHRFSQLLNSDEDFSSLANTQQKINQYI